MTGALNHKASQSQPSSNAPEGPAQRPFAALLLRLLAGLALGTMFMMVKYASERGVALTHLLLFRQGLSVPIMLGWMALAGRLHGLRTRRLPAHALRSVTGLFGMVLTFAAPILLPLAVSTAIGFSAPVFAVILSALLLREHVGKWRWMAVVLGFAGVLLIVDPTRESVPLGGAAVALGSAFMIALISNQIRDLAQTEDAFAIVFYFAAFATPLLFVAALFFSWPDAWQDYALLVALGLVGALAQVCLTLSLRFGKVSSVIVMDYAVLIWSTIYGWVIFGNLPPSSLWIGAPLVIAAGIIIVWRESVLAKEISQRRVA